MKSSLLKYLLIVVCCLPLSLWAADSDFVADKDYKILKVTPDANQANTVVEFFNPGCPACFQAEPAVESWLKTKPKAVKFSRVPLAFHEEWKIYSEAYYVACDLNIENKILPLLFHSIHVKQQFLSDPNDMAAFFVQVSHSKYKAAQIKATFNSMIINAALERSQALMNHYQIYELPSIVVSGHYVTSVSLAKSPERMMKVVNYLLTLEK